MRHRLVHGYFEVDLQKVIGMRHRLVHGYFEVDLQKVWVTVHRDLPLLIAKISSPGGK